MFESKINRGRANGYAPLDSGSKVPLSYLPPIQSTIDTGSLATTSSLQSLIDVTGSFATTGSNQFNGDQSISGSLNVSSSLVVSSTFVNNSNIQLSGSDLIIDSGSVQISGSINVSGSVNVTNTFVNRGTIDALNSDLIIEGGYLILTGSEIPTNLSGSEGDKDGMVVFDDNYLYYCTADYVGGGSPIGVDATDITTHQFDAQTGVLWNDYGSNYLSVGFADEGESFAPVSGWYFVDDNYSIKRLIPTLFWANNQPMPQPNGAGWLCDVSGSYVYSNSNPSITFYEAEPTLIMGPGPDIWKKIPLNGIITGSQQILDLGFVTGSYTTINSFNSLTQSFNSISQSFTTISGSVGGIDFNGLISGSSQLTSSFDVRYALSGSVQSGTLPNGVVSGSSQLTSSFDTRYLNTGGDGVISGSSQLTSSFDIRYAPSASYLTSLNGAYSSSIQTLGGSGIYSSSAQLPSGLISGSSQLTTFETKGSGIYSSSAQLPSGLISGSSQLTSSYDTRYTLSGSVVSGTTPSGTISGSSQLTSSFDGRYVQTGSFNTLTASFNSFTASAQAVTTGSNSFNGTQTITGSLIITTGSFVGSQILANTASLYLTSGSNMYVQNNGVVEITGSLRVSGSAAFNVTVLSVDGRSGDEGGEINLGIPVTNTTLQNRVTTDVWQNRYRIFEGSANAKGVFVDLSKAPAGVGGELLWKASGFVNAGDYVILGDLKARIPSTGNKSLQVATISSGVTYSVYGSGIYSQAGSIAGTTLSSPLSITSTPAYLNASAGFTVAGATDTWIINDISNFIGWRITMVIGPSFNANLITIERLY